MVRERVKGAAIHDPDPAVRARFDVWRDTVPMIREKPLDGPRPGQLPLGLSPVPLAQHGAISLITRTTTFCTSPPTTAWSASAFLGVVVLGGLAGFLLRLRRVERDKDAYFIAALCGSVAAAAVHAVFDFNLHIYSNNQMLILLAGVTASGLFASGSLRPRAIRGAGAVLAWGGGLAAALALLLVTGRTFVSYGLHHLGETDRERFRMESALGRLELARAVDRANWRPWLSLGHLYRTRSFWALDADQKAPDAALALECYEAARVRNPLDMMVLFGMARARVVLGRPEEALEILRAINQRDRNNMFFSRSWACNCA